MKKIVMGMVLAFLMAFAGMSASNAAAAQNQWQYSKGHWYYYNASGVLQKGWLLKGQKWYFFNYAGIMQTGWSQINGKWYYFDGSGAMKTGWMKSGSSWYFLNSGGDMRTGWLKSGTSWYYLHTSGAMQKGWSFIRGKWYFFDANGAMKTGWLESGDDWYYLDGSGAMVTGWVQSGERWYYMDDNGVWAPYAAEPGWEGEWVRPSQHYGGVLTISNLDVDSLYLKINVMSGANTGEMEGYAKVSGKNAVFVESEWGTQCKLFLTMNTDSITVEQSDECEFAGGMGTFFDGEYIRSEDVGDLPKPTLASQGIVDAEHDAKIQQLLGSDYDYLVESMQLVYSEDDLDGLGATVITGAVRGLFTIMEGAIMYDPNGYYYVALISEDLTVKFYTNNPNYKTRLPRTIDSWRDGFSDYPVEFYYKEI